MIDVVLLLIIFFSMTSQFSESQNQPMDLPQERGQAPSTDDAAMSVVLDLDQDGGVHVMGKEYSAGELRELLARHSQASAASSGAPLEVVVRADRRCLSSHLEQLARQLADAGFLQWKIATTGKREGES
jgi:biopolymer transport protein ExbD